MYCVEFILLYYPLLIHTVMIPHPSDGNTRDMLRLFSGVIIVYYYDYIQGVSKRITF